MHSLICGGVRSEGELQRSREKSHPGVPPSCNTPLLHIKQKAYINPDNRTKYAPRYHLNSRFARALATRNVGRTKQLDTIRLLCSKATFFPPAEVLAPNRTLSERPKKKYSSFSSHFDINDDIIPIKRCFVKAFCINSRTVMPFNLSFALLHAMMRTEREGAIDYATHMAFCLMHCNHSLVFCKLPLHFHRKYVLIVLL